MWERQRQGQRQGQGQGQGRQQWTDTKVHSWPFSRVLQPHLLPRERNVVPEVPIFTLASEPQDQREQWALKHPWETDQAEAWLNYLLQSGQKGSTRLLVSQFCHVWAIHVCVWLRIRHQLKVFLPFFFSSWNKVILYSPGCCDTTRCRRPWPQRVLACLCLQARTTIPS